ncbi:MAG: alpha/beta hydrolase [Planctomycetales bacterium]|nr:alpha/beta hydrolase [Planctomycetales bacterium]
MKTTLYSLFVLLNFASLLHPARGEYRSGVVYATRDANPLTFDLAIPEGGKMHPVFVYVDGGEWDRGGSDPKRRLLEALLDQGWAGVVLSYRNADTAPWPAQIDDVQAAWQWLIDHQDECRIDSERMVLGGRSAGSHLALLLGLRDTESSNNVRPRAIVNLLGPTDFRDVQKHADAKAKVEALLGGKITDELLREISPLTYVDRTDPPVLTFHGTADKIVPFGQARTLHAALDEQRVPSRLVPLQDQGHELGDFTPQVRTETVEFLRQYFSPSSDPLVAYADFDDGSDRWKVTDTSAWKLTRSGKQTWFSLVKSHSQYEPKHRSPFNIALLEETTVSDFVFEVDLRSTNEPYGHQSLCLFFGHQDPEHFYYVHLGRKADAHANSIFIVNDAPRVSIAQERTDGTDWSRGWHRARIRRKVETGSIEVYFDDMSKPIMKAIDTTFGAGRIGIGSFDDTGEFDTVRVWGRTP